MQAAEHMQVLPRSPYASGLGSLCKLAHTEKKKENKKVRVRSPASSGNSIRGNSPFFSLGGA